MMRIKPKKQSIAFNYYLKIVAKNRPYIIFIPCLFNL